MAHPRGAEVKARTCVKARRPTGAIISVLCLQNNMVCAARDRLVVSACSCLALCPVAGMPLTCLAPLNSEESLFTSQPWPTNKDTVSRSCEVLFGNASQASNPPIPPRARPIAAHQLRPSLLRQYRHQRPRHPKRRLLFPGRALKRRSTSAEVVIVGETTTRLNWWACNARMPPPKKAPTVKPRDQSTSPLAYQIALEKRIVERLGGR